MKNRYPFADYLNQTCSLLELDPARVLRRVGLADVTRPGDELLVNAAMFFRLCEAIRAEAQHPDFEMVLAMAYAHGPFISPIFAFSCAENLALGLQRLSDFKPLLGPFRLEVKRPRGRLALEWRCTDPALKIPASLGLFELLYITECARTFTGASIVPIQAELPDRLSVSKSALQLLGSAPAYSGSLRLAFSASDAVRPLITRSAALWESVEPMLTHQLAQRADTMTMSDRVRAQLLEALPGGSSTAEDIARRLHVSKRSLQRKLHEEGTSFQAILSETRSQLSARYLRESELSVSEISYLLGFRETSSFFRAFQAWTGTTPGEFRNQG